MEESRDKSQIKDDFLKLAAYNTDIFFSRAISGCSILYLKLNGTFHVFNAGRL